MGQPRLHYPVRQRCRVLSVVASRYYAGRQAQALGEVTSACPGWEKDRPAVFDHQQRRYATPRRQVELQEQGQRVGRQALRTARRRHGRRPLQPKAYVLRTTDATHGQRYAPNRLLDQSRPTQAGAALPLARGAWAYCCAFQQACTKQGPAPGRIVHADRGGQYVGNASTAWLHDAPAQLSHRRRGDCYATTQAENWWVRLKTKALEARE